MSWSHCDYYPQMCWNKDYRLSDKFGVLGEEMRKLKVKKEKCCVLDVGFGLIRKGNGK